MPARNISQVSADAEMAMLRDSDDNSEDSIHENQPQQMHLLNSVRQEGNAITGVPTDQVPSNGNSNGTTDYSHQQASSSHFPSGTHVVENVQAREEIPASPRPPASVETSPPPQSPIDEEEEDNTSQIARLGNRVLMAAKNEADNSEESSFNTAAAIPPMVNHAKQEALDTKDSNAQVNEAATSIITTINTALNKLPDNKREFLLSEVYTRLLDSETSHRFNVPKVSNDANSSNQSNAQPNQSGIDKALLRNALVMLENNSDKSMETGASSEVKEEPEEVISVIPCNESENQKRKHPDRHEKRHENEANEPIQSSSKVPKLLIEMAPNPRESTPLGSEQDTDYSSHQIHQETWANRNQLQENRKVNSKDYGQRSTNSPQFNGQSYPQNAQNYYEEDELVELVDIDDEEEYYLADVVEEDI